MSAADTFLHGDRISVDPLVCNGKPSIKGTRISVETVLGYLSAGETRGQFHCSILN